jgi:preprotein translocase subunit SecF
MRILANQNFNFIKWRWHAIVLSLAVVGGGLFAIASRGGLPLGIDFSGGTLLLLQFEQPTGDSVVRNALAPVAKESVVQQAGGRGQNQVMVRLPMIEGAETARNIEDGARLVEDTLRKANIGNFTILQKDIVGPIIGDDLKQKGIYATIASMLGIMAYIALRFRLSFGVGAAIASVHDVLVTLSILTLAGYELSLNIIAAILTLVGYGVNDRSSSSTACARTCGRARERRWTRLSTPA